MYENLIAIVRIVGERSPQEGVDAVQPPCGNATLLKARIRRDLQVQPPPAYIDFINRWDGIRVGSLSLFGSKVRTRPDVRGESLVYLDGIVEYNQDLRSDPHWNHVLALGQDDSCLYGLNLKSNTYGRWDKTVSDTQECEYKDFDDMMNQILLSEFECLPKDLMKGIQLPR